MQKLALATAIATISTTAALPAFASSMTCNVGGGTNNGLVYTTTATSNGISVAAALTVAVYYVDNAYSSSSSKLIPTPPPPNPYTLVVGGDWCIDNTTGSFEGNIAYGDFKTQANVTGTLTREGRQTFVGVNQAFSGTGTWGTNGAGDPTLSYSYLNSTVNGGGASVQTQTSSSCANGGLVQPITVCTAFGLTSPNWEGLSFLLTFDATKYSFTGNLTAIDTSGASVTRNTVTINWNIAGVDPPAEVPVPTAAWLFGSGLIGLAGAARRRSNET